MNIARLINFNSCDGVAYSEIQLKAITPTIATSEPFPHPPHFLLQLNGPFVLLSAVCGPKVKKTWMRHTRSDWCAKCSSVCSLLFVFIAVLITSCTAQPTEVINYSRIHYTRMGNLNFAHATPPPPTTPDPRPWIPASSLASIHISLPTLNSFVGCFLVDIMLQIALSLLILIAREGSASRVSVASSGVEWLPILAVTAAKTS